ncbi:peptidoglycan-binding protein [Sulfitobacter sp.]|nr:peptidoglycan-binding protein [Sulfitobacter sp.]
MNFFDTNVIRLFSWSTVEVFRARFKKSKYFINILLLTTIAAFFMSSSNVKAQTPAQCFQNPSLCQKSPSTKTKKSRVKKEDLIRREFRKFNAEERIQIQKTLADEGLYTSTIDGLYGKGTRRSIKRYLRKNRINWSSSEAISVALNKLVIFKEEVEQFASKISEDEAISNKLESENFIADLEAYVNSGDSNFDLNFAIEFAKISDIKKGRWNSSLEEAFNNFKVYVSSEVGFIAFHKMKTEERQQAYQDELLKTKEDLFELVALTRTWAKSNLFDERTADVIKLIATAEAVEKDDNLSVVEEVLAAIAEMNEKIGIVKPVEEQASGPDYIQQEYERFNVEGRMQIQKTLADEGLYTSAIDGLYGAGIRKSIKAYLDDNGVNSSSTGAISVALNKLVIFKEEVEQFASKINEDDAISNKLESENFIADLEAYVNSGDSNFDLNFAIEFAKISDIKKGRWNSSLEEAFNNFKVYVSSEVGFIAFHKMKTEERQQAYQDELLKTKEDLFELVALTRTWAKSNLFDERTADVIKLIATAEAVEKDDNLSVVEEVLAAIAEMNEKIGIVKPTSKDIDLESPYLSDALYLFGNFSGNAPHLFKGLSGQPQLSEGMVNICVIGDWDKWQRYTVLDYVADELSPKKYFISEQACQDSGDILAITGLRLIEGRTPLAFSSGYEQLREVSRSEAMAVKAKLSLMSEIYEDSILSGEKSGYGVLSFDNSISAMCLLVPEENADHIDALRGNFDLATLFEESLQSVQFNENIIDAFRQIQRDKCGYIYAVSQDLAQLIDAAKNSNLEYTVLPVWVTDKVLLEIAEKRTQIAKIQLSEQEARQQKMLLNEQARKAAMAKALVRQAALRNKYDIRYTAILDQLTIMTKTAIDFGFAYSPLDANYTRQYLDLDIIDSETENSSPFDPIIENIQELALEKWEQTGLTFEKIDYGSVNYNGRILEGVVVEIKLTIKNRVIGEFATYCRNIRAIQDADFDMWRKIKIDDCQASNDEWELANDFESRWIVTNGE